MLEFDHSATKRSSTSSPQAASASKTVKSAPISDAKVVKKAVSSIATRPVETAVLTTRPKINKLAEPELLISKVVTKTGKKSEVLLIASVEQLLAMPESDYMGASQLHYFRKILEGMRADILVNAGETSEHLRENVVVPDPADRATIEEEHAIELRTRDRERKLLKKIAQAIDVIDRGEYGWCEETGDMIGLRRLIARPTATLSLEAQQRRELRQKMYGD